MKNTQVNSITKIKMIIKTSKNTKNFHEKNYENKWQFVLRTNHRRVSVHVSWWAGNLVFVLMQNPNEHFIREILKDP